MKSDRIKASTAVKFAREIPSPPSCSEALNKASDKVEELYKTGRRKNKRITEGEAHGQADPMKVVNDVAAELKRSKLAGADLLDQLPARPAERHGQHHPAGGSHNGAAIPAPPEKKRGRKKKEPRSGEEATAGEAPKAKRKARKEELEG
ncbi:MAG: hypothetical protein IPN38_19895 [Flavobacteriales bacterium]|nr:hypothetical protein [Flavobacteriales bacterium]